MDHWHILQPFGICFCSIKLEHVPTCIPNMTPRSINGLFFQYIINRKETSIDAAVSLCKHQQVVVLPYFLPWTKVKVRFGGNAFLSFWSSVTLVFGRRTRRLAFGQAVDRCGIAMGPNHCQVKRNKKWFTPVRLRIQSCMWITYWKIE